MSRRGRERASGCSIIVRNLSRTTRADDLRYTAEKYGPVRCGLTCSKYCMPCHGYRMTPHCRVGTEDVYIPVDYMTRLPRGIAFIEFTEPKDAEDAIYGLDRKVFDGREISVQFAMEGRKRPEDAARARFDFAGSPRRSRHLSRSRSRGRSRRNRSRTVSRSRSRARSYTPSRSPSDRSRKSRPPVARSRSRAPADSPARSPP